MRMAWNKIQADKKPAASGTERVISSCDFTNSSTLWNVVFTVLLIPWRGPKACNYRVIWILFVVSSGGTIALFYIWRLRSHKIMFPSSPQPLQFVSCNHKQVRDMRAREKVKSVASRTCQELREKNQDRSIKSVSKIDWKIQERSIKSVSKVPWKNKNVASKAFEKLLGKTKSVASKAFQKWRENVNRVASRVFWHAGERTLLALRTPPHPMQKTTTNHRGCKIQSSWGNGCGPKHPPDIGTYQYHPISNNHNWS